MSLLGVEKMDWFLNMDLKKDSGRVNPAFLSTRSSFETGDGPIEYKVLSHLFELDSSIPDKLKKEMYTVHRTLRWAC